MRYSILNVVMAKSEKERKQYKFIIFKLLSSICIVHGKSLLRDNKYL